MRRKAETDQEAEIDKPEIGIIGPRREKACLQGVRQSEIQTSLLSYRD